MCTVGGKGTHCLYLCNKRSFVPSVLENLVDVLHILYFATTFTSWNKKRQPFLWLLYSTPERLNTMEYSRCYDRSLQNWLHLKRHGRQKGVWRRLFKIRCLAYFVTCLVLIQAFYTGTFACIYLCCVQHKFKPSQLLWRLKQEDKKEPGNQGQLGYLSQTLSQKQIGGQVGIFRGSLSLFFFNRQVRALV